MSDPTKVTAINHLDEPRYGALVRLHITGSADGVLTLPPRIQSEAEATHFLFTLGMKLSGIDPNVDFTDDERAFIQGIFACANGLVQDGLEWKTIKVLNQAEVKAAADYARRQTQ